MLSNLINTLLATARLSVSYKQILVNFYITKFIVKQVDYSKEHESFAEASRHKNCDRKPMEK